MSTTQTELRELKVGDRVAHREDMGPPFTFGGEVVDIEPDHVRYTGPHGRHGHIGVVWNDEQLDDEVGPLVQFYGRNDLIHADDPDAQVRACATCGGELECPKDDVCNDCYAKGDY